MEFTLFLYEMLWFVCVTWARGMGKGTLHSQEGANSKLFKILPYLNDNSESQYQNSTSIFKMQSINHFNPLYP